MSAVNEIEIEIGPIVGTYKTGRDPIEQFKNLRETALEVFKDSIRAMSKDEVNDGHDVLVGSCAKALDYALTGALTEVAENYLGFTRKAELTEDTDNTYVDLTVRGDLVDCYFAAVNS
jgi:hypothetical protein